MIKVNWRLVSGEQGVVIDVPKEPLDTINAVIMLEVKSPLEFKRNFNGSRESEK